MTTTILTRPTNGGGYGGMEDDDNARGYERDETDQYHRLVRQLVADGDYRARSAGRHARRTLAEMAPGYVRQPVLVLTRPLPMLGANDACGICGRWNCDPSNCPPGFASAPASAASARAAVAR
ncbi:MULTISPECIES: hypothetical protein [unclassified Streptomyces]|uniref:hypothetical protein n=1 Tax=unclassified Streptomyces TaxID=2593676 RepID=UPI00081BA9BB|nr:MULTISPECIES: hypothetical protein [unclassified Streptomyces]MYQ82974.1 hypothetical protein [Streptomyces sp. SID4936]SCD56505.1 hypothetical protein GA0115234_103326 [Streptomyces sp. DvalAA-43]